MLSTFRKSHARGFTLIEMLVVILIIFILIGIALAVGMQVQASSQIKLTKMELTNLQSALNWYHHKTGQYPVSMEQFLISYQYMHAYQIQGGAWRIHSNVISQLPAQNVVTTTATPPNNGSPDVNVVCEVLDGFGNPIQYFPPASPTSQPVLWPQNAGGFTTPITATPVNAVFVVVSGTLNGSSFNVLPASSNGHGPFFYSLGSQYNSSGTYSTPLTVNDYLYSYAP